MDIVEEIARYLRKREPTRVDRIDKQTYQIEFGKVGFVVSAQVYRQAKQRAKENK